MDFPARRHRDRVVLCSVYLAVAGKHAMVSHQATTPAGSYASAKGISPSSRELKHSCGHSKFQIVRTCDGHVACRGRIVRGAEAVVRSRYDEDVFPGNHTSVWGSFWADGKWGYACCKSHLKNSLCMGSRVRDVAAEVAQQREAAQAAAEAAGGGDGTAAGDADPDQLKRKREEGDAGGAAPRGGEGNDGAFSRGRSRWRASVVVLCMAMLPAARGRSAMPDGHCSGHCRGHCSSWGEEGGGGAGSVPQVGLILYWPLLLGHAMARVAVAVHSISSVASSFNLQRHGAVGVGVCSGF